MQITALPQKAQETSSIHHADGSRGDLIDNHSTTRIIIHTAIKKHFDNVGRIQLVTSAGVLDWQPIRSLTF